MWTKKADSFTRSNTSLCDDSWEEKAFAEDAAGHLGGCTWPPRSYHCSFCGREFRSAQALGGHMNVHRRDRAARLKQSPNHDNQTTCNLAQTSVTYCLGVFNHPYPFLQPQVCALVANHCPGLNPKRSSSAVLPAKETLEEQILFPRPSSLSTVLYENNEIRSSVSKSEELQSRSIDEEPIESLRVYGRPDQPSMNCCKRRRMDSSSISFLSELRSTDHKIHVQSEIIGLDLELRLGLLAEDEVK